MKNFNSQKGISLYYAVLIMSISLAVALGLNTIVVKSVGTTQEIKKSPPALHGADTGVEQALYDIKTGNAGIGSSTEVTWNLGDGRTVEYSYEITTSSPRCPEDSLYCIEASGIYQGSKRFIDAIR